MPNTIKLIVFPAPNLEKAKVFYNAYLGVDPYAEMPYYVGYRVGDMEIGLDPRGEAVISYIDTEDIEASIKELEAAGATLHSETKNVGGGLLVAQLRDPNGNILGLRQQPKAVA